MRIRAFLRRFAANEAGVTAMIFALSAVGLLGMVGAAVDGGRWYTLRRQHANAIDAALLAAARMLQVAPSDATGALDAATKIYRTTLPQGAALVNNTVAFVQADRSAAVSFTGSAFMKTTFLNVLGIRQLQVSQPAKAVLSQGLNQGSDLEIALMLDMTGSMCNDGVGPCGSGTKIDGARLAATDLANIVLGQTATTYRSRMALVPFSVAVRVEPDGMSNSIMPTLTGLPKTWSGWLTTWTNCSGGGYFNGEIFVYPTCTPLPKYVTNYKILPCVTERTFEKGIGFDPGDSAPSSGNWLLGQAGNRAALSLDSTNTPLTSGTGNSSSDPSENANYTADGTGCPVPPGNEILPLTDRLSDVTDRLGTLTAFGPTAGALGTVWTQYMLSPNWSAILSGSQRPGSYTDAKTKQSNGAPVLRKVAVLMTDGGFNTMRQNAQSSTTHMQAVSNNALAVCENMKKNGIEIYTVGFNLNALIPSEKAIATKTLQDCGTDIKHFYDSLDSAQLQQAFRDIALKLTPVRLTQ